MERESMDKKALALFVLEGSREYGEKAAAALGLRLGAHEERDFVDGEHKIRPLESVREKDVYVIHSLYGDDKQSPNDKLCRLLFFIGALKDSGAARVTAVAPYLCYARKDRKTKSRDPVTTRYVAQLFESVGTNRIVTIDVHNLQAYQNAFRCHTEHLEAAVLFAGYFSREPESEDITVVSPDIGGIKRAMAFAEKMEEKTGNRYPVAFMEKKRSQDVISGAETVYGDVTGHTAIIFDDMIASGSTMQRAAHACREQGAAKIYAAATHGLFSGKADEIFADPVIDKVIVTDTVPPFRLTDEVKKKLAVIDTATLTAEAIRRLHEGGSLVALNKAGI